MKICPFVSHMLGDENQSTLTIEESRPTKPHSEDPERKTDNVVILGYEGEPPVAVKEGVATKTKKKSKKADTTPSHLHCLKESCRFYQGATGDCKFDMIFSMLKDQGAKADKEPSADTFKNMLKDTSKGMSQTMSKDIAKDIAKDIDKIWKFQTKSVTELIESFGDSETKQSKSFDSFRDDVAKNMDVISGKIEKSSTGDVKKQIDTLQKKLDDRAQGFEDLSTTMSELVLNLHESIGQLQSKSENLHKEVDKLRDSLPTTAAFEKVVDESISGKVKSIDDSISKKIESIEIPNIEEPLRELGRKLEESLHEQANATPQLEEKLEDAIRTHKDIEKNLSDWHEKIDGRISDLNSQQQSWDARFDKLAAQHSDLVSFLEEGKKLQETERSWKDKKEARKYNNLGVTSFHNGVFEMAKEQFLQAVKIDPDFAEAYNNLGLAYTEINDEEHASEAFEKAVELNPALHAAYNNLGYIFFKQGNYDQAIEMYNEALGRSTDNSSAYTNLGNAYFKLDKMDEARNAWQQALDIDPSNEKASKNLQRISEDNK